MYYLCARQQVVENAMSADFGLGKEVVHGIIGAVGLIVVCVAIGSFVAQSLSHGPQAGHGEEPAAAAAEKAAPADAKTEAKPDGN